MEQTEIKPSAETGVPVKKPTHLFWVKFTAVVVLTALFAVALLSGTGAAYTMIEQEQNHLMNAAESSLLNRELQHWNLESYRLFTAEQRDYAGGAYYDGLSAMLEPANTNYRYTIKGSDGMVIKSSLREGESLLPAAATQFQSTYAFIAPQDEAIEITGYVASALTADDSLRTVYRNADWLFSNQQPLLIVAIVASVLGLLLFIFLMCASGRHSDSVLPRRTWFDKLPFDLLAVVFGLVSYFFCWAVATYANALYVPNATVLTVAVLIACIIGLMLLALCMSAGARIKTHTFWRSCAVGWCILGVWKFIKWVCRGIRTIFSNLPVLWKTILCFVAAGLFLMITFSAARYNPFPALLFAAAAIGLFVLACYTALEWKRLQDGARALAEGHMEQQVDTEKLHLGFKEHGENLNSISRGMSRAVEERMKSERMKTDLITNVSHDLKTPLTSIVSYVDLLKKEALENETAKGYVEVLDRQAAKLKKLTEDLVEASRASSGAINVNLMPTNAVEILNQSLAEYAEKLAAANVSPVVTAPEEPLQIMADGRLLWRVFDNLLNNVVKYAMPGTRVYCTAVRNGNLVTISVKNVSRAALNISPEELTERFVRGDSARTSEGSGLGLSIAKSLTELQKGQFRLFIDGDLFRAELQFLVA